MKKILKIILFSSFNLLSCGASANVDPNSLVKVTTANNPQCVEYYNYNGAIYCSLTPQGVSPVDPNIHHDEKQKIVFDDRVWQAVWSKKTRDITTIEYIPAGDNINQWHELVTSQFIPGMQTKRTPREYANAMIANMQNAGIQFQGGFVDELPNQVIYEFSIHSPANLAQDELFIVKSGNDGLYILHYAIKDADMGEKKRAQWLDNLRQSEIDGIRSSQAGTN